MHNLFAPPLLSILAYLFESLDPRLLLPRTPLARVMMALCHADGGVPLASSFRGVTTAPLTVAHALIVGEILGNVEIQNLAALLRGRQRGQVGVQAKFPPIDLFPVIS